MNDSSVNFTNHVQQNSFQTTSNAWTIVHGRVLDDNSLTKRDITFHDGQIDKNDAPTDTNARQFDAAGCLVLPGIVDIHGDAFEHIITPRTGVSFDIALALREADRQLIANGITTAYHGLTVSWEPGERSIERGRTVREVLNRERPNLHCSTHLHIRWETFALDTAAEVAGWLADEPNVILAFNDHTTESIAGTRKGGKIEKMAQRAGLSVEDFKALMARVWERRDEVNGAIERMAAAAREAGATLLAHDETSPEQRMWFRNLGARASEFPTNIETAANARAHDEHTILGAPNVLRGCSHTGHLSATEAIVKGMCTVLATDYYYPAPLHAAFKLVRDGICGLPEAWRLISANPAEAAGFTDRGSLTTGKRADVVVINDRDPKAPRLVAVFVAGKPVFMDLTSPCLLS
ncbi:MAG: alpha-D-ribose 1-methylphosphonate 5-triphosphate diphosphatase [Pseudomonadota bacterium]